MELYVPTNGLVAEIPRSPEPAPVAELSDPEFGHPHLERTAEIDTLKTRANYGDFVENHQKSKPYPGARDPEEQPPAVPFVVDVSPSEGGGWKVTTTGRRPR